MASAFDNSNTQLEGRRDSGNESGDKAHLTVGNQLDPSRSFDSQISKVPNTADCLPGLILTNNDLVAKVNMCDRITGPDTDQRGNQFRSYMLGDNEVFRETLIKDKNEKVLQSFDNGKTEGRQNQEFDKDGNITHIRSVFQDSQGKGVIINRDGANGAPEVKVDSVKIEDPKIIKSLLERETELFTPPKQENIRNRQQPSQGGPPA